MKTLELPYACSQLRYFVVLSATKGGSRAAAGVGVGGSGFPGVGASSLCLSHPQELEMQARVHGLPTTSPSGMNMAELAQQVVKQELPSEEGPGEALLLGAEVPDPEPLPALPPQAPPSAVPWVLVCSGGTSCGRQHQWPPRKRWPPWMMV